MDEIFEMFGTPKLQTCLLAKAGFHIGILILS